MGELRHGWTCFFNINYHIVWSTKYRRKVLNTDIERRLKEILIDVGKQKGFEIAEIEVGMKDHVHVFVSAIPKISISYIAIMMSQNVISRWGGTKKLPYAFTEWGIYVDDSFKGFSKYDIHNRRYTWRYWL